MKNLLSSLTGIIIGAAIIWVALPHNVVTIPEVPLHSHLEHSHRTEFEEVLGAFNPVAGTTYRLQTSAGSTATSISLSSFTNRSDIPLTMSILDTDIGYGTLSPQSSRSELVSFTGITQNANGTAQLTGVSRGLSDIAPFTASTTLRQRHPGQSIFILSDSPQLFEEYAKIRSTTAITGQYNFNTVLPSSSLLATTSEQFVNKSYADGLAIAGIATSTESNFGGVTLATQLEMASTTHDASDPKVPYTLYSTSTPDGTSQAGLYIPVSKNNGKLHQLWLDLTEDYTWTGHHIFSSLFATNASSTNATTTNQHITGLAAASGNLLATDVNGLVIATTTPVGSFVGAPIATTTSTNGTFNLDTVFSTGFEPTTIIIEYSLKGEDAGAGTDQYSVGKAYYTGDTITANYIRKDNESGTDMITTDITTSTSNPAAGDGGGGARYTISVPTVTSTSFTVRVAHDGGSSFTGTTADLTVSAYR